MRIIFLGTASSYPTTQRGVSCTAVRFEDGDVWIFDCGEGSQIQIQKSSIHPGRIKKIFITHLHGDHLFGLPGLMCTLGNQVQEKSAEFLLEIYGPLGLKRYLRESLNLSRSPLTFQYVVHELIPPQDVLSEEIKQWAILEEAEGLLHLQEKLGKQIGSEANTWHLFEDDKVKVEAGFLIHRIPTFGFVIKEKPVQGSLKTEILLEKGLKPGKLYGKFKKGESVILPSGEIIRPEDVLGEPKPGRILTILGDTCDSTGMIHIAEDSDLLIHEATLEDGLKEMALKKMHSTPSMAVDFASKIKAKKLILFHFSQRYRPLEEEEKDSSSVYTILEEARMAIEKNNLQINVDIAHDFMEVDVKRRLINV
ncbi:zinc phosphodiesterase ELAC protein 1-like isoform X1 [Rhodnius prolixus]|uniref:zinc phosphodiesterase ELAC protein 1-like isoform X1 n=2 Tax=Rhodnius prolixus TaxID=13249 RepID=UPI003D18EA70